MAEGKYEPLQMIGQEQAYHAANVDQTFIRGVVHDRPGFAAVEVDLQPMQKVLADGGAMIWMDGKVNMETNMGNCQAACCRFLAGESCCQNVFTGPGKVTFAQQLPGDALPFAVTKDNGWILSSGAFLSGTHNLEVSARFAGCMACLCSGEGCLLTQVKLRKDEKFPDEKQGMFFAGGYGALTRHEIPAGKTFYLDLGLFFAANEKTKIEIGYPGSLWNCFCGGEGLVMKFTGPTVIYSQNRPPGIWRKLLLAKQQAKNSRKSNASGPAGGM